VNRLAVAAIIVAFASSARADAPAPTDTPSCGGKLPACDDTADIESREANLETTDTRYGFTFAFSPGVGFMFGGDIGVGRGGAISLRLGHVATRNTVITFELSGTSAYHRASMMGSTLSDTNYALLVGAQRFKTNWLWWRAAGGLTTLVKNADRDGTGGEAPIPGAGALVGAGANFARWGYLVFGIEGFALASISSDGFKTQLGFNLQFALN
jgi:hypothetical protein